MFDLDHFVAFACVCAAVSRVVIKHLVEILTEHLVSVRRTFTDGAFEGVGVVAALVIGFEIRAGFENAERANFVEHA